ncbi:hypothetical protein [Lactobacillus intestinalis]|uniref:hypothetical protein n=1 Tax=Lactobacillus intestinalis TaxID=151781 RepID=UPI00261060F1|nr:hypothetical protein [Lactobacillus intestinalis]
MRSSLNVNLRLKSRYLILCYTPAQVYVLNALPQESVVSGNTIIVTMVQVANSFCTALAVIWFKIRQDLLSMATSGHLEQRY